MKPLYAMVNPFSATERLEGSLANAKPGKTFTKTVWFPPHLYFGSLVNSTGAVMPPVSSPNYVQFCLRDRPGGLQVMRSRR